MVLTDPDGQVTTYALEELQRFPTVTRKVDIHCVTRWSQPQVEFTGVTLDRLLLAAKLRMDTPYVSFVSRSERNHSTSLPLADALALGTMLVWEANGAPLETAHGGPLRTVTPGKYFYKSLKWLARIDLLKNDRLGYWEAVAGYHNGADPWREERYLAPTIDRHDAARLLAAREFGGRDLRGIDARGRDLAGLNAREALLRDSDFRGCQLSGACFDLANLSNARLADADLRGASFQGADLEGADFTRADVRGADFTGASLFGATFAPLDALGVAIAAERARWDDSTRFDHAGWEALLPAQRALFGQGSA